jgi:hypothetical protein
VSDLSNLFGDPIARDHVRVGAWSLCPGCSKGRHTDHTTLEGCQCDLCQEEDAA